MVQGSAGRGVQAGEARVRRRREEMSLAGCINRQKVSVAGVVCQGRVEGDGVGMQAAALGWGEKGGGDIYSLQLSVVTLSLL